MPDARTHDVLTVISGAVLVPCAYAALVARGAPGGPAATDTAIFFVAHMLSGVMFSPDLDLDSAIDNRWGVFGYLWRPYMWLVPHRNFWSHGLVIPPLLRLLYFYLLIIGFVFGGSWLLSLAGVLLPDYPTQLTSYLLALAQRYPRETAAVVVGFVSGGAVHSVADWLVTGGKHYLHRLGFRPHRDYTHHDEYRWRRARHR